MSAGDFLHSLSMLPVAFRSEYEDTIHKMLPFVWFTRGEGREGKAEREREMINKKEY